MQTLERVRTARIDSNDTTFCITCMPDLRPLCDSIQLVGLLEPVTLRERDDRTYQIVCGFKRVEALDSLAVHEIEAFVYQQGELDDLQALQLTIAHNLIRPLNLVEKAWILEKLLAFGLSEREVIDRYLPLLNLQPNVRILRQMIGLLDLEQGLLEYLVKKDLSLSASACFLHLNQEGQQAVLPLLEALRPGENRVKEIISFLREISLRDGVSISSVLDSQAIREILSDQERPRPQRLEELRRILKQMRFPCLTQMEKKFADFKRSLSLPSLISFYPPPFFEGEEFRMELRFKDFPTFRRLATRLHQIAENEDKDVDPLREISRCR